MNLPITATSATIFRACAFVDCLEERVDCQFGEYVPAFLGVVAVTGVVLHHEPHRSGGAEALSQSFPTLHSDLVQRQRG